MKIQKRHAMPGKFHWEPYGTQWHFVKDSGTIVVYIQISHEEQKPRWVRYGSMLEVHLNDRLVDENFIDGCINSYKKWLDSERESDHSE
jgi:hypothetical protein